MTQVLPNSSENYLDQYKREDCDNSLVITEVIVNHGEFCKVLVSN